MPSTPDSLTASDVQNGIWRAAALRFLPRGRRRRFIAALEAEIDGCVAQLDLLNDERRQIVEEAIEQLRLQVAAAKQIKA